MYIDDDDFFEFEPKSLDVSSTFNFTCKFKIIDSDNGYKLSIHKIYKRSLSKANLNIIENLIENRNIPMLVNDVSGLELENFKVNKLYDGEFEMSYFSNGSFDIYLGSVIEK
jgi:hypothetical protein